MDEAIAVVGVACRLPGGVNTPAQFWSLLRDGRDVVGEVPPSRWKLEQIFDEEPGTPGKLNVRSGGFLSDVSEFDADFFGISPREATAMDPQQRLLLEVSWEALEASGYASARRRLSKTGVFVGMMNYNDYALLKRSNGVDASGLTAFDASGDAGAIAAGRLAYTYNLKGPAITIDTACSSGLVAAHLACLSLRNQDCRMALVAGVHLMLMPDSTVAFCQAGMLAQSGRCRTFDERADGYVRGEGCIALVMKRLSDAHLDGDHVIGILHGSSVNQDGKSAGLTAPSGIAQQAVVREALDRASSVASSIGFVEAHGSATRLGDPLEMEALGAVYGSVSEAPAVGSVKTNLGHLEPAAGLAGLLKTMLARHHEEIPPHLNLGEVNHEIPLDKISLVIPSERRPWPSGKQGARGAVSSFGFSGTNAHVIIGASSTAPHTGTEGNRSVHPLVLSARTEASLRALARRMAVHFREYPSLSLVDVCYSAAAGRAPFEFRLALNARSTEAAATELLNWAAGRHCAVRLSRPSAKPRTAWLLDVHEGDLSAPVRALFNQEEKFRVAVREWLQVQGRADDSPLDDVETLDRPLAWAVAWGFAQLWRCWGLEPHRVFGPSIALRNAIEANEPRRVGPGAACVGLGAVEVRALGEYDVILSCNASGRANHIPLLGSDPGEAVPQAVTSVFMAGGAVDWSAFFEGESRRTTPLPTYPFEHRSFWLSPTDESSLVLQHLQRGKLDILRKAIERVKAQPPTSMGE